MSTYAPTIRRCQHIKVNGVQCGSPAKRNEMHCFFHEQCRLKSRHINMKFTEFGVMQLPILEDANSIQLGLAEVMRMIVTSQIDHRVASLLLRALRIAVANVKFTSLEPQPTHVVIDPKCVEHRPLGATAWSTVEGHEFDLIQTNNLETGNPKTDRPQECPSGQNTPETGRECERELMRLIAGCDSDPNFLDKPAHRPAAAAKTQSNPHFSENREPGTENCR